MNTILAFVGAALVVLSGVPYAIDIIRGKSRPNVVSWFTWTLLISVGAFGALAAHETKTAIITFGDVAQVGMILLLGLRFGYAKFSRFDGFCQVAALGGLALWLVFDSPILAIILGIAVDFIAAIPTFRHSWIKPSEETWQTYTISGFGAIIGLGSLTSYSLAALAYPTYLFLLGFSLAGTIIISRKKKGIALFR